MISGIEDAWVVVDDVIGSDHHRARLQWLLPDCEHEFSHGQNKIELKTSKGSFAMHYWCSKPATSDLVRAGADITAGIGPQYKPDGECIRGWRSRYYSELEPALSFVMEANSTLPIRFISFFVPAGVSLVNIGENAAVLEQNGGQIKIALNGAASTPISNCGGVDR
jgi:hypothetical protein